MRPQVCSVLVWSVSGICTVGLYVVADSMQEVCTCLFAQVARVFLKRSQCLTYAAQAAMIIRCITLSWLFSLIVSTSIRSIQHFLPARCSRWLGCCLQPSPLLCPSSDQFFHFLEFLLLCVFLFIVYEEAHACLSVVCLRVVQRVTS